MNWLSCGKVGEEANSQTPVVFLPGWGFDGGVLNLAMPFRPWWNPAEPLLPEMVIANLDALLRERQWRKIILVGWSLGARLALEYAACRPATVETLVLLSLRSHWPEEELASIRSGLTADPDGFMTDFYRKCFLGYRQVWREFVAHYLEEQLQRLNFEKLFAGLSCLAAPLAPTIDRMERSGLLRGRIWFLHGEKDIIAPFEDRFLLRGERHMPLKKEGHALFLAPEVQSLSFLPANPSCC